jgi:hypothetical protein
VIAKHQGLAVPKDAVLAVSAGKGEVRIGDEFGHQTAMLVNIGAIDDDRRGRRTRTTAAQDATVMPVMRFRYGPAALP